APAWLEWPQEILAGAAQRIPLVIVAHLRQAQNDSLPAKGNQRRRRGPGPDHFGLAPERFADAFHIDKAADRTDPRQGWRTGGENLLGHIADALRGDAVDALDGLGHRNRPAPQDLLARQLSGARGRAFERHQQAGADLIADADHFVVADA